MARVGFAAELLKHYLVGQAKNCPYCGSFEVAFLGRKFVLLQWLSCRFCGLNFRYPKPTIEASSRYYQSEYRAGPVTDMPNDERLATRIASGFQGEGPGTDYRVWITMLKQFRTNGRVFELGCSWGYGLWQLRQAGYEVIGYEISRSRAEFGRVKLNVEIYYSIDQLLCQAGTYDIVFSAHVLEHLSDLAGGLDLVAKLLKPGGLLLAFVPHGGGALARAHKLNWGPFLSEDHLYALTPEFLGPALTARGFAAIGFDATPYGEAPVKWPASSEARVLDGEELMIMAEKG